MPLYVRLFNEALLVAVGCLAPVILCILIVTIATALIQSALQLEETALSLLPKTLAVILLVLVFGLHLLGGIERLMIAWLTHADGLVRQPWV